MKEIKLTQGKVALVDDDDYEYLNQFKWFAINYHGYFYAGRKEKGKVILMHREILRTPHNLCVDHVDHNGLNNLRVNIRNCTVSQNAMNTNSFGKSKYKGIWFSYKKTKNGIKTTLRSAIRINGILVNLGSFNNEIDAAKAYDKAALKHFGKFANINFSKNNC